MPIEDADKVHSRRGEKPMINIFGFKISFITLMITIGVGIAAIFLLIAGYMMMMPQEIPIAPVEIPRVDSTNITFDVVTTNYNYRIIKMTYMGGKTVSYVPSELLLSIYPPQSHYVQRQAVQPENVSAFDSQYNTLYMYIGIDNLFHLSYNIPQYSDCVDFINGDWSLNIDDNIIKQNMYKFNFNIANSRTIVIENGMSINDSFRNIPDYSTVFVYQGTYKERVSLTKSIRLMGVNGPVIDGGGSGADITIYSNNNVISGFTITNSGIKEFMNGGIVITTGSTGNIITKNTIYKTIHGIWIYHSGLNTITSNTIRNNDKTGIMIIGSSSNTIINNIIYNNIDGIRSDAQSDLNIIRENNVYDNKGYGIIIDSYSSLRNTCEYNIYKNNKMSCSDSIDRDQTPVTPTITTVVRPIVTQTASVDWWSDCKGNPKCYQS